MLSSPCTSDTAVWSRNDCAVRGAVAAGVGVAGAGTVARDGFAWTVFATTFGAFIATVVVAAVVVAVSGNGGNLTIGNRFGITFAVPAGVGVVEVKFVAVDEATVDVVKTGSGIIALSIIALCAEIATDEVAAAAGVEVDT